MPIIVKDSKGNIIKNGEAIFQGWSCVGCLATLWFAALGFVVTIMWIVNLFI